MSNEDMKAAIRKALSDAYDAGFTDGVDALNNELRTEREVVKRLLTSLETMAALVKSQDNLSTADPIFYVQQRRRLYGFDTQWSDNRVWLYDGEELSRAEQLEYMNIDQDDIDEHKGHGSYATTACRKIQTACDCTEAGGQTERACAKAGCTSCKDKPIDDDELFDFLEAHSSDLAIAHTAYQDLWENVQPFFTRAGAEEYIRINGHNLKHPRIYVESAFRNAEWQAIRKLLAEIAP